MVAEWILAAFIGLGGSVLAYSVGAVVHIYIDRHYSLQLKDQFYATAKAEIIGPLRSELLETIDEIAERMPGSPNLEPLKEEILGTLRGEVDELRESVELKIESVRSSIPAPPGAGAMGAEFESFLRSESGKQWALELANVIGANFEAVMVQRTASSAGAAARTFQAGLSGEIYGALKGIDFGNQVLNGVWNMIPDERKRWISNLIARAIRKGSNGRVIDAQFTAEESQEGAPELAPIEGEAPEVQWP